MFSSIKPKLDALLLVELCVFTRLPVFVLIFRTFLGSQ